ncbi:hypothetical protein C8R46DRAFT_1273229 [Mycena filopes]|nr:hypothetical protein C8R46DRAFT_1273229 [Mycena filopes]
MNKYVPYPSVCGILRRPVPPTASSNTALVSSLITAPKARNFQGPITNGREYEECCYVVTSINIAFVPADKKSEAAAVAPSSCRALRGYSASVPSADDLEAALSSRTPRSTAQQQDRDVFLLPLTSSPLTTHLSFDPSPSRYRETDTPTPATPTRTPTPTPTPAPARLPPRTPMPCPSQTRQLIPPAPSFPPHPQHPPAPPAGDFKTMQPLPAAVLKEGRAVPARRLRGRLDLALDVEFVGQLARTLSEVPNPRQTSRNAIWPEPATRTAFTSSFARPASRYTTSAGAYTFATTTAPPPAFACPTMSRQIRVAGRSITATLAHQADCREEVAAELEEQRHGPDLHYIDEEFPPKPAASVPAPALRRVGRAVRVDIRRRAAARSSPALRAAPG